MVKIGLISLGCPKNVVDAEEILGAAEKAGYEIETDPEKAEVLIVNTCGFIQSAKEESIESVLDAVRYKTNGACNSVIVTGCLAQRYGEQLAKELPEADAFIGLKESRNIDKVIAATLKGEKVIQIGEPGDWWLESGVRILSTPPWTAYLRIADGCDNRCTYCAIPDIRGRFRSRSSSEVLAEAAALADSGVKELNLVAQDITRFGLDIDENQQLPKLLDDMSMIEGLQWIRLLYCYPTRISDKLIKAIARNDKVCKYIDVPLQHCSEKILRSMGRKGTKEEYIKLFERIRENCPEAALRTTFIVGFPGETEDDFAELLDFVQTVEFDRLGVFCYSEEDGTPAAVLPNKVSARIAARRQKILMKLQSEISLKKNKSLIGTKLEVLVESIEGKSKVGRSYRDAPEIDGLVYIEKSSAYLGDIVQVEITDAREYDLTAAEIE